MITNNEIKFLRTLHSKRGRETAMLFIAEGEKLVNELLELFSVDSIYRVGDNCNEVQMQKISQLKTPTEVLATFKIPQLHSSNSYNHDGRVIVLDSVQDPGNIGTILRTADWFGVKLVVCSNDCADTYASKVVQATMGSIGRVKVVRTDIAKWIEHRKSVFPNSTYGTFLENSASLRSTTFHNQATIVMGNEGRGISDEVEQLIDHRIHIPYGNGGGGESLNVAIATAVVLSSL